MSARPAPPAGELLAIVAHELRSPLNGIKGWTHVLENQLRGSDATSQRAIAGIMTSVEQQVRLIEDLLEGAHAARGEVRMHMPLLPALAASVESLRGAAAEKGVALVVENAGVELSIDGDPHRVRAMLASLLANAIRFAGPGGALRIGVGAEGAMA